VTNIIARAGLLQPAMFYETNGTFEVEFINTPNTDLTLLSAKLEKKANAHDILILEFKGEIRDSALGIASGDPVKFSWNYDDDARTWVGYVHSIEPSSLTSTSLTTVVCVGASYVLKDSTQAVFKNVTADQVVARVASAKGFKVQTQRHPRVFPTISNTGQSDWQLLRRLALQCGFVLITNNTLIKFKSKSQMFKESLRKQLYFRFEDQRAQGMGAAATLINFTAHVSDQAPDVAGANVDRVISGIDEVTGNVIKTTHKAKRDFSGQGVKGAAV